jgi:hypothetical protein
MCHRKTSGRSVEASEGEAPISTRMTANGMVRPCSCPTSEFCWDGASVKRSTAMSKKSIATIATQGIDIGKNSFHVIGLDQRDAIVLRQKWSRGQIEARFANMPPCLIGMEACVGAHHLSRELQAHGHDARLATPSCSFKTPHACNIISERQSGSRLSKSILHCETQSTYTAAERNCKMAAGSSL